MLGAQEKQGKRVKEDQVKTVTMTGEGQVTLSSAVRKQLGLEKGATLKEVVVGNCVILMPQNEVADQIRRRAQMALHNAGVTVEELKLDIERLKEERFNKQFPDLAG